MTYQKQFICDEEKQISIFDFFITPLNNVKRPDNKIAPLHYPFYVKPSALLGDEAVHPHSQLPSSFLRCCLPVKDTFNRIGPRCLNMILNGYSLSGGQWANYKACKTKPLKAMSDCVLHPHSLSISRVSSSLKSHQELRSFSPQVAGAASSPLCGLFTHKLSPNISRKRHSISPRASKDAKSLFNFKFPPMDKKPRWWWRTLAALPYLMPLHETWMYAETACHLHPFLDELEDLTTPFLSALGGLPSWFLIAYFIVAYLAVVRRKEWPHFFRFHVVTGMLLEITLQVTGTAWRWLPHAVYWGKVGMHFWTFFAFAFLFTVLECIRCCLAGIYADVPFVSEAAYIQIPFE